MKISHISLVGISILAFAFLLFGCLGGGGRLLDGNDISIGPADAKVTIVEFSYFECPACKAAEPTTKKVLETYSGKIRFVYRHFLIHEEARKASEAA